MPEVIVASLDERQRKLVENVQLALDRGQLDYVSAVSAQILRTAPGCLPVRRLQRLALLRQRRAGNGLMRTAAAVWFSRPAGTDPAAALARAETWLAWDPRNVSALRRLAGAAMRLDLPETAAFALAAIQELVPDDRSNLLALGEAWLAAGQPGEALAVAESLLAAEPAHAGARLLQRHASVAQTVAQGKWAAAGSLRGGDPE